MTTRRDSEAKGAVLWESLTTALARLTEGSPPPEGAGMFGATPDPAECRLLLLPVPWDATVSYKAGTALGPVAIVKASHQLDLEDACFGQPYRHGITMLPPAPALLELNASARPRAVAAIALGATPDAPGLASALQMVNQASHSVNTYVEEVATEQLNAGKLVGVVGGDHSSPFGLIRALAKRHEDGFGILHFDAHHDLRVGYEGFTHSHASIMYNVLTAIPAVQRLVQIGIRDYAAAEAQFARAQGERVRVYYARDLFRRQAEGETWGQITAKIIASLPPKVYVSFDIDGLDPTCCPSTGTPVPGGLSYEQAMYIIEALALSGKQIIGFDLCEVAPGADQESEWDANVGARVLYKLCGALLYLQPGTDRKTSTVD